MTTRQFTHPLGRTGQDSPIDQGIDARLPSMPDAAEIRRLLQKLGEFFLNVLDRYVELVGPDTSAPQAPIVSWTPYSGVYIEAMRWRSNRYRWGGQ